MHFLVMLVLLGITTELFAIEIKDRLLIQKKNWIKLGGPLSLPQIVKGDDVSLVSAKYSPGSKLILEFTVPENQGLQLQGLVGSQAEWTPKASKDKKTKKQKAFVQMEDETFTAEEEGVMKIMIPIRNGLPAIYFKR